MVNIPAKIGYLWLLILGGCCHQLLLHSAKLCMCLVFWFPHPHPVSQVSKALGGWVSYPGCCSEWLSGEWNFCSPYPQATLPRALLGPSPCKAIHETQLTGQAWSWLHFFFFFSFHLHIDNWWVRAVTEESVWPGLGNHFFKKLMNWPMTIINISGLK